MLGKLLVTLIVGGIIYFLWRNQQYNRAVNEQQKLNQNTNSTESYYLPSSNHQVNPPIKLIFFGVLAIMILATAAWTVYVWQDQRTLLEVKVITANHSNGYIGTYKVYKKDLQERGFTTKDGQIIRIANSDRLEVRKIETDNH